MTLSSELKVAALPATRARLAALHRRLLAAITPTTRGYADHMFCKCPLLLTSFRCLFLGAISLKSKESMKSSIHLGPQAGRSIALRIVVKPTEKKTIYIVSSCLREPSTTGRGREPNERLTPPVPPPRPREPSVLRGVQGTA